MPSPAIPAATVKKYVTVVEKCLAEGYGSPGLKSPLGSAVVEAAKRLGVTESKLKHQLRTSKPNWKLFKPATIVVGGASADKTKIENKELHKALKKKAAEHQASETALAALMGLKDRLPSEPSWTLPPRKASAQESMVPTTIWSDWQIGEVIHPEEVGGLNSFDQEIALARVKLLVENTLKLCFDYMTHPTYPGLCLMLGGDMISGQLHPELAETDWGTALDQMHWCYDNIGTAITELRKHFPKILIPCVFGNHGRNTHKPHFKNAAGHNHEHTLYKFLAEKFAGDPNIRFLRSRDVDCYFRLYGHRYRLTHGDNLGTAGGDGIIGIYGKVKRGDVKIRNAEAPMGRDHDTLVIGHFHQCFITPPMVVNGSLPGYSEYAKLKLRVTPEPPAQAMWFTHPELGLVFPNRVFVDKPLLHRAPIDWASWPEVA